MLFQVTLLELHTSLDHSHGSRLCSAGVNLLQLSIGSSSCWMGSKHLLGKVLGFKTPTLLLHFVCCSNSLMYFLYHLFQMYRFTCVRFLLYGDILSIRKWVEPSRSSPCEESDKMGYGLEFKLASIS